MLRLNCPFARLVLVLVLLVLVLVVPLVVLLRAFWGEPGAEANEVSPFRREGCTPEPVEPEPEPLPVPSVFGPVRSPLD